MYQHFYQHSDLTICSSAALILFLGFFIGVVASVFLLRRDPHRYDGVARLPLDDDEGAADV